MSSVTDSTTTKLPSAWAKEACDVINSKTDLKPVIGIVLGSGMGDVAKSIENPVVIPYGDYLVFLLVQFMDMLVIWLLVRCVVS